MKKVLMIAPYFVPRRRVGSYRSYKFVKYLQEYGWNPAVVYIESDGELKESEKEILSKVTLFPIKTPMDRTERKKNGSESKGSTSTESALANIIDRNIPFDSWWPLMIKSHSLVSGYLREFNPQIIWSTGDPWSSHWLAYILKREFNLPWVADFRDPWTLTEVDLRSRSSLSAYIDKVWESKIVNIADRLIFTAESTEHEYQKAYPVIKGKTHTIYNAFDDVTGEIISSEIPEFSDDNINVIFFGTFRHLSPVDPVIHFLNKLQFIDGSLFERIRIHSFGNMSKEQSDKIRDNGLENHFAEHQKIHPSEKLRILNKADFLLISTDPNRKHIIPAKLWDYLPVNPPILSIATNPEIKHILNITGRGKQYDLKDELLIADFLKGIFQPKRDDSKISKYHVRSATKELVSVFNNLVSND